MNGEIFRQKSDPMKELFFSFLHSVKHSRGHRFHASFFVEGGEGRPLPCKCGSKKFFMEQLTLTLVGGREK